jgi:hypothetical protein
MQTRTFKYSGLNPPNDPFHYTFNANFVSGPGGERTVRIAAPSSVQLPGGKHVAQWAPTVRNPVAGFHPNSDCDGNFTAAKHQPNNNCYNYACNIASNSFAVPGRLHGANYYDTSGKLTQQNVIAAAQADGLKLIGNVTVSLADAVALAGPAHSDTGHLVCLLISDPIPKIGWDGDFHFVRSDYPEGNSWSQKSGTDQIADFDFAGEPISDPSAACWVVNQGPAHLGGSTAFLSRYFFAAWMFVSVKDVQII